MSKAKKKYTCLVCSVSFIGWAYQNRKTCSSVCAPKYTKNSPFLKGESHPNYKDGKSKTKEYMKNYGAAYYVKHKEKILNQERERYLLKADQIKARIKQYSKDNPEKKQFSRMKYKLRKRNAVGSHTLSEWQEVKKLYGYMCACCKKQEPEVKITQDHIIPLSKGGTNTINNIQPLCVSCNSIKMTRTIYYPKPLDTLN